MHNNNQSALPWRKSVKALCWVISLGGLTVITDSACCLCTYTTLQLGRTRPNPPGNVQPHAQKQLPMCCCPSRREQFGKIIRLLGLENLFNKKAIQPLCSPTLYQRKDVAQPPRRCAPICPLAKRLLKWSVGSQNDRHPLTFNELEGKNIHDKLLSKL